MRPKIGLALASGSARGLAHIGIIKALQKNKIPIHHIAGCSIGAVVGAMIASGTSTKELERFASEIDLKKYVSVLDFRFRKAGGLLKGEKLKKVFRELLKVGTFEELKIPLSIVATDFITEKQVVFESGDLIEPMRASISIPGIFQPVRIGSQLLVDGGMVDPLPIGILKEKGCDVIIAADISYHAGTKELDSPNIYDMIVGGIFIMQSEIIRLKEEKQNSRRLITIRPRISQPSVIDFRKGKGLIEAGEKAAHESMDDIKDMIRPRFWEKLSNLFEKNKG
jgi:NTE family protein